MKRTVLFAIMLITAVIANGQVKLEDVVKPGTVLKYGVEAGGAEYEFIVTVKDKMGSSFDWEMTAPANMKGSIVHTSKALAEGNIMWNFFRDGTKELDDETLSVWLSQKLFNALSAGAQPADAGIYGPGKPLVPMLNSKENDFTILLDGKTVNIHEKEVSPAIKDDNGSIRANPNSEVYFTYNNSASLPIILRMRTVFFIYLKSVETK